MRLPVTLVTLGLAAGLLLGCGSSGDSTTGATSGPAGSVKAEVRAEWVGSPDCARPSGASRWSCSVGRYRCQAVVTDRGWSVDCARSGQSIPFTVQPRK